MEEKPVKPPFKPYPPLSPLDEFVGYLMPVCAVVLIVGTLVATGSARIAGIVAIVGFVPMACLCGWLVRRFIRYMDDRFGQGE